MEIYFLGTASGLPTPRRFSQTIVFNADGELHVLDVADGASSLLCRHGLDHKAVRSVVISHMHGDHHGGLIQLLKTMMHHGRKAPLLIYMPGEGIAAYQRILEACYLIPQWLGYDIEWRPICDAEPIELSPTVTVRAIANDHLHPFRVRAQSLHDVPGTWRFESYSFLLGTKGLTLAYSGNLNRSLFEMQPYATGVDVLICELAHLEPADTRQALEALRPRLAIFTHFNPRWDDGRVQALQEPLQGIDVRLAEDGDVYDLNLLLSQPMGA